MDTLQVRVIGELGEAQLALESDMNVEPGHQWLLFTNNPTGLGLAAALYPAVRATSEAWLRIPHDADVDLRLMALFNLCATIRFSAPQLVQLEITGVPPRRNGGPRR